MMQSHTISFKSRSVHSLAKAMESLAGISDLIYTDYDPDELGLRFVSFYKAFGHSIEMFCKIVLERHSKYLLLEKISVIDQIYVDEKLLKDRQCGGVAALARASRFLKKEVSIVEIGVLEKIIEGRNLAQHGHFHITNFKSQYHEIVKATIVFMKMYKTELGNFIKALEKETDLDVKNILEDVKRETNDDFISAEKEMIARKDEGKKFRLCTSCRYPFAELSSDDQEFSCLWCNAKRKRLKCTDCDRHAWVRISVLKYVCPRDKLLNNLRGADLSRLEMLAGVRKDKIK